jgi:hypothetical protein
MPGMQRVTPTVMRCPWRRIDLPIGGTRERGVAETEYQVLVASAFAKA